MIESKDHDAVWGTVGVSENVIEASWLALVDAFEYKLAKDARIDHGPVEPGGIFSLSRGPARSILHQLSLKNGHRSPEETAMNESVASTDLARLAVMSLPATFGTWPTGGPGRALGHRGSALDQTVSVGNSIGHLILHLTGNLNHYIGSLVAGTGYERRREQEFTDPARIPR